MAIQTAKKQEIIYPKVIVMIGANRWPFAVIGRVRKAMAQHGLKPETIQRFTNDALSEDEVYLMSVVRRYVTVLDDDLKNFVGSPHTDDIDDSPLVA